MVTIDEISTNWCNLYHDYKDKEDKLDRRIDQLESLLAKAKERKRNFYRKNPFPSWHEHLLKPIIEELVKFIPCHHYRISGPFGICSESPVFFYQDAEGKGNYKYIFFLPLDLQKGELAIRDYSIDTKEFSKGTIGEINGMNHPSIDISKDTNIEDLLKYVISY